MVVNYWFHELCTCALKSGLGCEQFITFTIFLIFNKDNYCIVIRFDTAVICHAVISYYHPYRMFQSHDRDVWCVLMRVEQRTVYCYFEVVLDNDVIIIVLI